MIDMGIGDRKTSERIDMDMEWLYPCYYLEDAIPTIDHVADLWNGKFSY
jgi:hypothetical protein